MRYPPFIMEDFDFPEFCRVRMHYRRDAILDLGLAVDRSLAEVLPESGIHRGDTVAVGVGSRGIHRVDVIVRALCDRLKAIGAKPVIIPAMGSHGGATPEGQQAVLKRLSVSAEACGAPVVSSLDVDRIGTVCGEVPLFFARDALRMDHTVVVNRIKPHTKFIGPVESGILKMLCVGMGKHAGAVAYHAYALKYGFFELLRQMGPAIESASNFRFGLAVVENAYDRPVKVQAVPAGRILEEEMRLNQLAKDCIPRLPFAELDVLVVERIGKEISGAGMDPNVTGRAFDLMESDFSKIIRIKRVAVLNLSAQTAGNGIGLGNADIITEKVFAGLDYEATLMNALTSLSLHKAYVPVRLPSDRKAIQAAFTTLGPQPAEQVRAVIIRDTRHISEFWASRALVPEIEKIPQAEILSTAPLDFDAQDNLVLPWE